MEKLGSVLAQMLNVEGGFGDVNAVLKIWMDRVGEKDPTEFIRRALDGEFQFSVIAQAAQNQYLRRVETGAIILTPRATPHSDEEIKKIFNGYCDPDFLTLDNTPSKVSSVVLYEMHKNNGTFAEIYGSTGEDKELMRLGRDQIVDCCVKHHGDLRQGGYGTFFVVKNKAGEYVVAVVFVLDGELLVRVRRSGRDRGWFAGSRHRFVFPQLVA